MMHSPDWKSRGKPIRARKADKRRQKTNALQVDGDAQPLILLNITMCKSNGRRTNFWRTPFVPGLLAARTRGQPQMHNRRNVDVGFTLSSCGGDRHHRTCSSSALPACSGSGIRQPMKCSNNLKQMPWLTTATTTRRILPAAFAKPSNWGWPSGLLPYIEQTGLYSALQSETTTLRLAPSRRRRRWRSIRADGRLRDVNNVFQRLRKKQLRGAEQVMTAARRSTSAPSTTDQQHDHDRRALT